jgi:hypothetical protein
MQQNTHRLQDLGHSATEEHLLRPKTGKHSARRDINLISSPSNTTYATEQYRDKQFIPLGIKDERLPLQNMAASLQELMKSLLNLQGYISGGDDLDSLLSLEQLLEQLMRSTKEKDQDIFKLEYDLEKVEEELHCFNRLKQAL